MQPRLARGELQTPLLVPRTDAPSGQEAQGPTLGACLRREPLLWEGDSSPLPNPSLGLCPFGPENRERRLPLLGLQACRRAWGSTGLEGLGVRAGVREGQAPEEEEGPGRGGEKALRRDRRSCGQYVADRA